MNKNFSSAFFCSPASWPLSLSCSAASASASPSSIPLSHEFVQKRHFSHELLEFFAVFAVRETCKSLILRRARSHLSRGADTNSSFRPNLDQITVAIHKMTTVVMSTNNHL